uniref:Uncharacterized protein n=2 Tax=Mucochytrium quahogii TaxID=96639 RepID=A0A7S2SQ02_9STRA|mmetsp:Transcript_2450/g.4886  ORF Transcript_2450/g.4886 Transcript_2450/m.4886 type:complete len:2926 (-) Transcript_2450:3298-12075(-)|eukprot:CAMPEP_0203750494 /NCGR_PEP_ID=MMETSP0098-20131031/4710_1 /ASSEMBLY_ACC=CAM_ASM_000208 /TAXON_ID=96639 /ORGANISM=" , Strain NY0313808BC1" /LENGTH=2925 /DNA_ID=CAMNT_0050639809 /DNA_START=122 /DNA_END=8899 /DNA_ORIENTATION=-
MKKKDSDPFGLFEEVVDSVGWDVSWSMERALEHAMSLFDGCLSDSLLHEVENRICSYVPTGAGMRLLLDWIRACGAERVKTMLIDCVAFLIESSKKEQFSSGESSFLYPNAYIECSLDKDDGLSVPTWNLGGLRGYSFSCYVNFGDDGCSEQRRAHRVLYRFVTTSGFGVEALVWQADPPSKVQPFTMLVRSRSQGDRDWKHVTCPVPVQVGRWHHIIVTHRLPYLQGAALAVYVDGIKAIEHALHYPKIEELVTKNFIGQGLGGKFSKPTVYEGSFSDDQAWELYAGLGRARVAIPSHVSFLTGKNRRVANTKNSPVSPPVQGHVLKRFALSKVGHITVEGISEMGSTLPSILKQAPGKAVNSLSHGIAQHHNAFSWVKDKAADPVLETAKKRELDQLQTIQERRLRKDHKYDDVPIVFTYDVRTCIGGTEERIDNLGNVKVSGGVLETIRINGSRKTAFTEHVIQPTNILSGSSPLEGLSFGMPSRTAPVYARLCGGANAVYNADDSILLENIGGVSQILILLLQLLPETTRRGAELHIFQGRGEISRAQGGDDGGVIAKVIGAICEALYSRELFREDFLDAGGFALIGYVLQRLPKQSIDVRVARACLDLVIRVGYVDSRLRFEGLLLVMCDYKIWGQTSETAQGLWIQGLLDYVQANAVECRVVLGVQTVLDLLFTVTQNENESVIIITSLVKIITLFFQSPAICFELDTALGGGENGDDDEHDVKVNNSPGPTVSEVGAVLSFISRRPQSVATSEIVETLACMFLPVVIGSKQWNIESKRVAKTLYESLQACGGIDLLLAIGSRETETAIEVPGTPTSPGTSPNASSSESPTSPRRLPSTVSTSTTLGAPKHRNGLLSSLAGVPARTRAAMILLIGRLIWLEERIEIKQMLDQNTESPAHQEAILEANRVRREKQFGIMLRSIMPVPHVASFLMEDEQVEKVSKDSNPKVLDALMSVILGGAASHEGIDDFVPHDDTLRLAVPGALPVLGGMLAALSKADEETKSIAAREILLKLSLVMKASYKAREQVTTLPRWQTWLIPVMLLHENSLNQNDDESADYLLGEVSTDLLCTLMEHETQRPDDSHVFAKKMHRAQHGWASWQGLAECTMRILKEKERSIVAEDIAKAKETNARLLPEYNSLAEMRATNKTARVMRQTLERVWERLIVRLQAGGLHPHAVRNFCTTVAMAEETLISHVGALRLSPLSAGGFIGSSSDETFVYFDPNKPGATKGVPCSVRCSIDQRYGTKWVDVSNTTNQKAPSWVEYSYPKYSMQPSEGRMLTRHRVVFYMVRSAFDIPDLDPSGWTLYGRTKQDDNNDSWVALDRRSEVRFGNRYHPIGCWVKSTGFFDEYRIVFEPPRNGGKWMKKGDGNKVYVRMQIGEVSFYECDVENWVCDSGNNPSIEIPEDEYVERALIAHGNELERFIKVALQTVKFVRSGTPRSGNSPRSGQQQETAKAGQVYDMPKRAMTRFLGHIIRNVCFFNLNIVQDTGALVQSFLASELSTRNESNMTLVFVLLYCLHDGITALSLQEGTLESEKMDVLFAVVTMIVSSFDLRAAAQSHDSTRLGGTLNVENLSVHSFLRDFRVHLQPQVISSLFRELEGEVVHRHTIFKVERSSRTAMARKANPVEVAAYGAGKNQRPVGLPRATKKRLRGLRAREDERIYLSQLSRRILYDATERKWRKILERDEVDHFERLGVSRVFLNDDLAAKGDYFRQNLYRVGKFVTMRDRISPHLVRNPSGDPHFGAASGIADRVNRKQELEKEREQRQQLLLESSENNQVEDLLGMDNLPNEIPNDQFKWENIGAKLSKQIAIADLSLMTTKEEEAGTTNEEDEPVVDKDGDESKKSSITFGETNSRTALSVDTQKTTPITSPGPGSTEEEDLDELLNSAIDKKRKLTIEEWINRSPDPLRGETKQPWPAKDEIVFAAARCHLIQPEFEIVGRLIVSDHAIYFDPDQPGAEKMYILRPKNHDDGRTSHDGDFEGLNAERWKQEMTDAIVAEEMSAHHRFQLRRDKRRHRLMWRLGDVDRILLRRYRMRDSALELFVSGNDNESYLFDLAPMIQCTLYETIDEPLQVREEQVRNGHWVRNNLISRVWNSLPNAVKRKSQKPGESVRRLVARYTDVWRERKMSNFEYLMRINALAGRSTCDLTQYPVFPWVLADYESEELDLGNEKVYRDLTKPMGALTEDRLVEARERYRTFDDPSTPKFHYGSHYSTMAGVVLYFLVRMEPYSSLHIKMQDGHFDIPDRLFNSVPGAWKMCTTAMSEVKELTPEFYSMPEFLTNHNGFNLGTSQNGISVGDVELPPWANGSSHEFVLKMRQALESEYVSQNLHHWIDLIFGYKSRLPEAVEADNVFYYLTYPGAVDMDAIKDPAMRIATELQIKHFGQCPMQIFSKPHPQRGPPVAPPLPLTLYLSQFHDPDVYNYNGSETCCLQSESGSPVLAVRMIEGRAFCLCEDGTMCSYNWGLAKDSTPGRESAASSTATDHTEEMTKSVGSDAHPLVLVPSPESLDLQLEQLKEIQGGGVVQPLKCPPLFHLSLGSLRRRLIWSSMSNTEAYETTREQIQRGIIHWTRDGRILVHTGQGIGTLDVYFFDTSSGYLRSWGATLFAHIKDVSALTVDGSTLVSGAEDGSVRVWELLDSSGDSKLWGVIATPRLTLTGHVYPISCVAVCEAQGIIVSASKERVLVHTIRTGKLLGTLGGITDPMDTTPEEVVMACISPQSGRILIHTSVNKRLLVFASSRPGPPLSVFSVPDAVQDAIILDQGHGLGSPELVVSVGNDGFISVWTLDGEIKLLGKFNCWPEAFRESFKAGKSGTRKYPMLTSVAINSTEEVLVVGDNDGTLCLFPLPNFVSCGPNVKVQVVGELDVNAKLSSAKNAVLTKIDTTRVMATARGVATEVSGVASKLAKGFSSVFGGG